MRDVRIYEDFLKFPLHTGLFSYTMRKNKIKE